ncbi:MAG: hypothetical protein TE42_08900 [Candidatus Synechococcus spongiarum SP3]|uniref:Uncharacterized protein n=1 Tax=Candidatus Synechococcus spongiarum SP3 TaxID=1604020 RepID=A0A0G2IVN7_9SYNE|nr:MAG: hypothetical protein TE42_08900 [Candidatus Synechococcus spongiarum SP3]
MPKRKIQGYPSGLAKPWHHDWYYCDHECRFALLIFLKLEKAHMSSADCKQIEDALQAAGLWPK